MAGWGFLPLSMDGVRDGVRSQNALSTRVLAINWKKRTSVFTHRPW
ncbi:MAG: hypothetical protein F6K50_02840 [Moorea sp. SIO3I7]|nr:hypothetical protein [Moorena sp. SIO3I7]